MKNRAQADILSTRLFPKGAGATGYAITGLAARCDIVVLSDRFEPKSAFVRRGEAKERYIFISLRNPVAALECFLDEVLPSLEGPVTVISGSEDKTFPTQLDLRFAPYPDALRARILVALDDPRIQKWYAENLSGREHAKLEPLPLGLVFEKPGTPHEFAMPDPVPLSDRQLTALCAHRVRDGEQWAVRRKVSELADTAWSGFCERPESDLSLAGFDAALMRNAFTLCVQGGGLDPSPKAWRSLLLGSIPVICASSIDEAYRDLPVVIIPEWSADQISPARFARWRDALAPWFEGGKRERVLERLGLNYWWSLIENGASTCGPQDQQLAIIAARTVL